MSTDIKSKEEIVLEDNDLVVQALNNW